MMQFMILWSNRYKIQFTKLPVCRPTLSTRKCSDFEEYFYRPNSQDRQRWSEAPNARGSYFWKPTHVQIAYLRSIREVNTLFQGKYAQLSTPGLNVCQPDAVLNGVNRSNFGSKAYLSPANRVGIARLLTSLPYLDWHATCSDQIIFPTSTTHGIKTDLLWSMKAPPTPTILE